MHRCCFAFQHSLDFMFVTFYFSVQFYFLLQKETFCLRVLVVSIQLFNSNYELVFLVDRPDLLLIIIFILLLNPFFEETLILTGNATNFTGGVRQRLRQPNFTGVAHHVRSVGWLRASSGWKHTQRGSICLVQLPAVCALRRARTASRPLQYHSGGNTA